MAAIYKGLRVEGIEYVAITGDLNDDPTSDSLKPLIGLSGLTDVSEHPAFDWNHRKVTYGSGNEKDKIDYILMSDPLYAKAVGGGVFRTASTAAASQNTSTASASDTTTPSTTNGATLRGPSGSMNSVGSTTGA